MPTPIPHVRELAADYGVFRDVTPNVRRVLARNPGAFTFHGTGTYVVGRGRVAVIDPGPELAEHIAALVGLLRGETVSHIVCTHTHRDHSPAARALKAATGAAIWGCGPHGGDRSGEGVEEGADWAHAPDHLMTEGDAVTGPGWTLRAVATPGHTSNHLCFALPEDRALLTGDHVMGWSTTIVSPPDGDMRAYMDSLAKVLAREERVLIPTHGPPVTDPKPYVRALIAHRREREDEILGAIADGLGQIPAMVARIYAQIDKRLHSAAARSVLAHLVKLEAEGRVRRRGEDWSLGRG
ncbi:MAG: MBL fold metallo-hydrolase [Alphaproteobacteria bacterium]|nr:MBL fold metallo-hydrolase [Alphaproteobacteria bacterium]